MFEEYINKFDGNFTSWEQKIIFFGTKRKKRFINFFSFHDSPSHNF